MSRSMQQTRAAILAFAGVCAMGAALQACSSMATLPVSAGTGPAPVLPPPRHSLIPTVKVATAAGWADGATPKPGDGLRVSALARNLDHPRWLYVLPNGDVLVAETNAPPKPDDRKGLRGWVMGKLMSRAGAGVPSANRITLLRDSGNGAVQRSVLIEGLNSPFGMALVGSDLYVADSDAVLRFPYAEGSMQIRTPGVKVTDLPAGRINHHWRAPLASGTCSGTKTIVKYHKNCRYSIGRCSQCPCERPLRRAKQEAVDPSCKSNLTDL